jgi:hypothetical protein
MREISMPLRNEAGNTGWWTRRRLVAALATTALATMSRAPLAARKRKKKKKQKTKIRRLTRTFANDGQIRIPGSAGEAGIANPYPSSIVVSGLKNGIVRHVAVTVRGLSHADGDEVLLLLAKDTVNTVLMVKTGIDAPVSNVTITFDDLAATTLPLAAPLTSGRYQPTFNDVPTSLPAHFPPPAPVASGNSLLSAFQGMDPNGSWRLCAADRVVGGDGVILGWELTITAEVSKKRRKNKKRR